MKNDTTGLLNNIINLANSGKNPQQYTQMLMQRNPQYRQTMQQLQNMANGMPMNQFVIQLARQKGVDNNTLNELKRILNVNN